MTDAAKANQQKYYDALLIRGWRLFQTVGEVEWAFHSIFGLYPREAGLLRLAPFNRMCVRHFVASRLPKINDRLLTQPKEKDALLLRKLETSKYDSLATAIQDKEITEEGRNLRKRRMAIGFSTLKAATRNRDTDWNVVK